MPYLPSSLLSLNSTRATTEVRGGLGGAQNDEQKARRLREERGRGDDTHTIYLYLHQAAVVRQLMSFLREGGERATRFLPRHHRCC